MIIAFNHAPQRPRGATGNSAAVAFFGFFGTVFTPPPPKPYSFVWSDL